MNCVNISLDKQLGPQNQKAIKFTFISILSLRRNSIQMNKSEPLLSRTRSSEFGQLANHAHRVETVVDSSLWIRKAVE